MLCQKNEFEYYQDWDGESDDAVDDRPATKIH